MNFLKNNEALDILEVKNNIIFFFEIPVKQRLKPSTH